MTLPGGPADKLGNRYEEWWTVSQLVRMLRGETESIRIEEPGVEKAEFVVRLAAHREMHQVKRGHPSGKWSLATLGASDVGLLQTVGQQLAGNRDRFVFASSSDAPELRDLCDAARAAESIEELKQTFLAAGKRKTGFERLLGYWSCDVQTAVERLRRIDVQTIDEGELEEKVLWGLPALFLAEPRNVAVELRAIARDSVFRSVTRNRLIEELDCRGYPLRRLTNRQQAGLAVEAATDRYLEGGRRKLIQQTLVPRPATATLLARLQGLGVDSVMTGSAGSGKTACVVEAIDGLRANRMPVLAFRLDRIPSVSTTAELGRHLELEESPVLVLAAAAEAAGLPGVLIVDQLDAVSTMSGRSSGLFDLVELLLHEARGARARTPIHTIVVCRAFDWRNDSRLRKLVPDEHAQVDVMEFTVDEVKGLLASAGFDTASFQTRQLELLRLPQNIALFLDSGFDRRHAPVFRTATDLFGRYWTEKRRSVEDRVGQSQDRWFEVVEILCDEMTSTQQLSVAKERLDKIPDGYLNQMASEGVVTFDGRRYGFGHESFFDYCFARVFFNRSDSLVSFLKGSEQHLFHRAQVRQVLTYLRDADPTRYFNELRGLLSDREIRAHIKDLAFALLAEAEDPTEEEWSIWQEWIAPAIRGIEEGTPNPDELSAIAWRLFFGSPSWFSFADQRGVVENWLASSSAGLADVAVNYLGVQKRHSPDRVAALLEPYADCGSRWSTRLRSFMEWADLSPSRRLFDLFLQLVDNGVLDAAGSPASNITFWSMLHGLGESRPEWVPEILAHRLRRRLAVIQVAGGDLRHGELLEYDDTASEMFAKSANCAPGLFVKHVLPVVLEVSDLALITNDAPPKRDAVWPVLMKTDHPDGEDACLHALTAALTILAREGNAKMCTLISNLHGRETRVANHLLLALYRGGAVRYANEAVSLLCDEPWRFRCGFSDSPSWCARELIQNVVPHCTMANRERLETAIMQYRSPFERTPAGYKDVGWSQFALLSSIPMSLRSHRANMRFEELTRKFREPEGEPRGVTGGLIESPIKKDATHQMTDEQWLRAISKYRSEYPTYRTPDDVFKGGAWQLAQVLAAMAKEEPNRFARLSLSFPGDANPAYLQSILLALADAAITSDLKLQVCTKAFAESSGPCGKAIADVLAKIKDPLPDGAVHMLHWLATEHEDPVSEAWQEDAGGGRTYYNGDILTSGINTARGWAVWVIRDLIIHDVAYVDRFRATLDGVVKDPSASVLSCVAGTLRAVAYRDPALALSLFLCMDLSEERLLATPDVYRFIQGNLRDSFGQLRPIVERMLRSSEPEVATAGARLASLAALDHDGAGILAVEAISGGPDQRLGVAQVAAANVGLPRYRSWCEGTLRALFDDSDVDVRRKAAACFRNLPDDALDSFGSLIEAFSVSAAFREDSSSILRALEASVGRLPGMTCVVCGKFLDRFAKEARDIRTRKAGDTFTLTKLIFRIYQQHQNDEWTSRSLDLIDRLCLEGIGDTGRQFEEFER